MIVSGQYANSRLAGFGGEWEDYCATNYAGNDALIAQCRNKNITGCIAGICPPFMAPWTDVGKAARGLPAELPPGPEAAPPGTNFPAPGMSMMTKIGLAVAALGIGFVVIKR